MKILFLITFLAINLSGAKHALAQVETENTEQNVDTPLRSVHQMPEFPGGKAALMSYLSNTIEYPEEAEKKGISGVVVTEFVVDAEGYVKNFTIKKGLGYGCEEEVIRVLRKMPRWRPAIKNDKNVASYYMLPITFKTRPPDTISSNQPVDSVRTSVQQMPEYPGGKEALAFFLRETIRYPVEAAKNRVEGQVFVEFTVDSDGSISNIRFKKRLGFGCDEEVIRMIRLMPKWKPGHQDGVPVPVHYMLPVTFKLSR